MNDRADVSRPGRALRKTAIGSVLLAASTASAQVVWSDEFDAGPALDTAKWTHDQGDWGWGNRELQNYTDNTANVRVEDGHLVITARREDDGSFTSGRIKTQGKMSFKYGTVEARIKSPDIPNGLWPAFWTLGESIADQGWPRCGEIDVLEMGHRTSLEQGTANHRVSSATHWRSGREHANAHSSLNLDENLSEGFHVYRLEWTPTSIVTKIDGQTIFEFKLPPETESEDFRAFHRPHFLLLNLAVGGNYPGILEAEGITATLPAELVVDWVRVYDNGFTELGGSWVTQTSDTTQPNTDNAEPTTDD